MSRGNKPKHSEATLQRMIEMRKAGVSFANISKAVNVPATNVYRAVHLVEQDVKKEEKKEVRQEPKKQVEHPFFNWKNYFKVCPIGL